MSSKIYEDRWGRQIVQFAHVDGPKAEIWAEPWRLSPEEAKDIGAALYLWGLNANAAPSSLEKKVGAVMSDRSGTGEK